MTSAYLKRPLRTLAQAQADIARWHAAGHGEPDETWQCPRCHETLDYREQSEGCRDIVCPGQRP